MKKFFVLAVLVLIAAGVVYTWRVTHAQAGIDPRQFRRRGGGIEDFPVVVRAAEKGNLDIYLNGLGTVTPIANVTVRTRISGQLLEVHFNEGQLVNKGDLLALIDPRPYQVALEQAQGQLLQAQAQLEQAQSELERFEMLAKQDSIAKQQLDTQRALVKQFEGLVKTDQAAIDNAQLNLDYCHVNAPITGRVGLRQVDVGNYVTPGDSNGIVVLTQVKPISVMFPLPEDHMRKVSERMRSGATLTVDAYDRMMSQKVASGTLAAIDNQADTATGTFRLRALFSNDDDSLFPNQFVNVRMLLDVVRDATVIPTSAIERGQDNTFVYVVSDDNIATVRPVTLGTSEGERVQVTSGLAVGERVVTEGADRLRDGAHVLVQQPGQTSATPQTTTPQAVAPQNGPGQNRPAQNAQPGAGGERRGRGQRGNGANGGGAAK